MAHNVSELRQDIVSGEWVTIATGRAKRPQEFSILKRKKFAQPKFSCPFEALLEKDLIFLLKKQSEQKLSNKKGWFVQVIKNKFPAFAEGNCRTLNKEGLYTKMEGAGNHEVVVTRDHDRSFAKFTQEESELVVQAYVERVLKLKENDCISYIFIFHNHGPESGATIAHPHSQIIALPVISPDVQRSLNGSNDYFNKYKRCVHCDVIRFEMQDKTRLVYENEHFVALCPFASKTAFEMRIFPKKHSPQFENINTEEMGSVGDALQKSLAKLYKGLKDPSYNFFIHTSPLIRYADYSHYHWHIEILPKTAIWAGFEIGTGIEISTIMPESAAKFLKSIKV